MRILEVKTDYNEKERNKLLMSVETATLQKSSDGSITSSNGRLTCKKVWQTLTPNQGQDDLIITLKKRCLFSSNKPLAKCALPLNWFPTNKVVRDWFPLQSNDPNGDPVGPTYVLMDVHIENRGVRRFMTEFSNLRVIPSWSRPNDAEADFPAPPQVIVVVPFHSPSSTPGYIAVGVSQYPTFDQVQQPSGITLDQLSQVPGRNGVPPILQSMPAQPQMPQALPTYGA